MERVVEQAPSFLELLKTLRGPLDLSRVVGEKLVRVTGAETCAINFFESSRGNFFRKVNTDSGESL